MIQESRHEPTVRELLTELEGFRKLMDERGLRYESMFKSMDEKTSLALVSSEKAVVKAETATEKRFEGVNEFRKTLSDQTATFLSKSEAEPRFISLNEKVENLRTAFSERTGRSMGSAAAFGAVALIASLISGLVFGVLSLMIRK